MKRKKEGPQASNFPKRYQTPPELGLTTTQVKERTAAGLVNTVTEKASKSAGQIIRSQIFTYFNFIFFLLAAVLIYEGSYNNLTFLGVVFANTIIGIVQGLRSKRVLDRLQLVAAPDSTAVRDGREVHIPSEELVLDDIVLLTAGNQICADGVVCTGELTVNESLVTGEADEIKKRPGDHLLSGSFVVSGRAYIRLDQVGDSSFAAQLSKGAKQIKKKQQPGMMRSLTRLIQVIGVIIIPFAAMMFHNQHHILGMSEKVSVENTAAAIIGMIPEGLYLLTSIALMASTIRLARKDTLVHDMKCIETLARVDTICVDKTGTITQPQMEVGEIISLSGVSTSDIDRHLSSFVHGMDNDNETMRALKAHFEGKKVLHHPVRILGFSSKTKFSAADFGGGNAYLLGAPEFLLKHMDANTQNAIEQHAKHGERVLIFAAYHFTYAGVDDIFQEGSLTGEIMPLALVTLINPVRLHAKETFEYFVQQGVEIKVISGDNPFTASVAAGAAGVPNADRYLDCSKIVDQRELARRATEYTVFGRVTPEQKRILIRALKKAGHTVAMTGDGVNDVLALKDADCSIAMASGSDAAANVSDLVLLSSDFACMPQVVAEGRRVINNIERSASLFLVKNIFSFLLSLISLISVSLYPLKPAQISLASALMIGIPSFFLALEPNSDLVHGKFLRNVLFRALPAALTAVILVEWSLLFADAFHIPAEQASTTAFFLYALATYFMLYRVCKPMTAWHGTLFTTMGVAFIAGAFFFPEWFHIEPLDFGSALVLSTLLLLAAPLDQALQRAFLWAERRLGRLRGGRHKAARKTAHDPSAQEKQEQKDMR